MSSTIIRASKRPFITVGSAKADYVVDGVSDDVEIQAAITEINNAGGGTLFLKAGTYNITSRILLLNPNVSIQGAGSGVTIIKASSAVSGGHMLLIKGGNAPRTENINISGVQFDANTQSSTDVIVISGGEFSDGDSVDGVTIDKCLFKNVHTNSSAHVYIQSGRAIGSGQGTGNVSNINVTNNKFLDTGKYHIYLQGNNISNLRIKDNNFQNAQRSCIQIYQYNKTNNTNVSMRSNSNWEIASNYFYNNNLAAGGPPETDPDNGPSYPLINDENRTGINGFKIHHNTFDGRPGGASYAFFALNLHRCWNLEISHNWFREMSRCLSIGEQQDASVLGAQPQSSFMTMIKNNFFYRCYTLSDHDSEIFAQWDGNTFYEVTRSPGFGGYARHWPSVWRNNFIYNTPCMWDTEDGTRIYELALFQPAQNGWVIENNWIIDDRLLPDPTDAPTTSTAVSGGSMGARTYYVKYTYVNDTGETLASPSSTESIGANQLLKFVAPSSVVRVTGTKRINVYVSTVSGSETLQGYVEVANQTETETDQVINTLIWTEPTTGLIAGDALPVANTTHTWCKYGIWETGGDAGNHQKNVYSGNKFYGIETPIDRAVQRSTTDAAITSGTATLTSASGPFRVTDKDKVIVVNGAGGGGGSLSTVISTFVSATQVTLANNASTTVTGATATWGNNLTKSISYKNIYSPGNTVVGEEILEEMIVSKGNISGAFTIYPTDGNTLAYTLTGNITPTINNGDYKGQQLKLQLTQDGTGSRTVTWPSNFKKAGGTLTLSVAASAKDIVTMMWDGTNWVETSRSLALS